MSINPNAHSTRELDLRTGASRWPARAECRKTGFSIDLTRQELASYLEKRLAPGGASKLVPLLRGSAGSRLNHAEECGFLKLVDTGKGGARTYELGKTSAEVAALIEIR